MNNKHRYLFPSISLLLVGTLFGCATGKSDEAFTAKTNATITFNAINGIGTWNSTKTSIRTVTLLKGYTWGQIKTDLKDKEAIIQGGDIDVIASSQRSFAADPWVFSDGTPISDSYQVIDDIILNANYNPVYLASVTFIADEETVPADAHHLVNGQQQYVASSTIEEGTKWKDIKDNVSPSYVPVPTEDHLNEPFLYYQNESGERVTDSYTFKEGDELRAVYQINHPVNFVTDSWETISDAANLGFESMSTLDHDHGGYSEEYVAESYTYHETIYSKNSNTFVGLRHEVQIGKKTYDAVVVGENVDKVSNTANATLTFQIEQVVNTNKSYDTLEHNLNRYSESALREYLNENFIYTLSPDLQNVIVPVNKRTNWGGRIGSQGDVRESMDYLFAFSLAELGFTETKTGPAEAEGFGTAHMDSYEYYKGATKDKRVRKTLNNEAMPYWLRSPDCDVTGFAWAIGKDGDIKYEDNIPPSTDVTFALSVVCGFCVGVKR